MPAGGSTLGHEQSRIAHRLGYSRNRVHRPHLRPRAGQVTHRKTRRRRQPRAGVGRWFCEGVWAGSTRTPATRRCSPIRRCRPSTSARRIRSHAEWCIKAARAKKHILCEKPLAMNHAEAMVVAEAAREHGVFLMEAFMYRCHPQTARLVELIRSGAIGQVGVIQASVQFSGRVQRRGPPVQERAWRRRHPRCRVLHDLDRAPHRRRRAGQALRRPAAPHRLRHPASRDRNRSLCRRLGGISRRHPCPAWPRAWR